MVISFGYVFRTKICNTNFSILLLGFLVSIGSLAVTIFHFQMDERRISATFSIAIFWAIMVVAGLIISATEVFTTSLILSLIGFVLFMIFKKTQSNIIDTQEVES